jgi:Tfp pilus assembly protein PilV
MDKKGFTFFEILLATFILSVVILGLVSVFVSAKKLIRHNKTRVTASELAKLFMDPFQLQVRQYNWGSGENCFSQENCPAVTNGTADSLDRNYTATYTFAYGDPIANLTRVKAVINWTESDTP